MSQHQLVVSCHSGGRSARAANGLVKVGFTKVYTRRGERMPNGWKNYGSPLGYDVDPEPL
jgi:rhodanese-related sulfurtransferase